MYVPIRAVLRRRLGWKPVEAELIDEKFVRNDAYQSEDGGRTSFQVWDYMVEVPGRDGGTERLVIREKTFKLNLPEVGGTVPVLVNRKRTKAMFDLTDPRIDAIGQTDRRVRERRERDEARFAEKLDER